MLSVSYSLDFYGLSDVGLVREQNQDAWKALVDATGFVLADGMGGHAGGEIAADQAVLEMASYILEIDRGPTESVQAALTDAIKSVNTSIYERGKREPGLSGMGTTLCVLYVQDEIVHFAHVGDSRIYRHRNEKLERLTRDDSLINELIDEGAARESERDDSPYKHVLTKALGTTPRVEPTVREEPLEDGDLYLLCSDGLTNFVSDATIQKTLNSETSLEKGGKKLVSLAKEGGGGDNVTVILIRCAHDLP